MRSSRFALPLQRLTPIPSASATPTTYGFVLPSEYLRQHSLGSRLTPALTRRLRVGVGSDQHRMLDCNEECPLQKDTVFDDGSFTETLYSIGDATVAADQEGSALTPWNGPALDGHR